MPSPKPNLRPADGALVDVRVSPRAGRSAIVLAGALGLPKRHVEIVSGDRSRSKRVRVAGLDARQVLSALGLATPPDSR